VSSIGEHRAWSAESRRLRAAAELASDPDVHAWLIEQAEDFDRCAREAWSDALTEWCDKPDVEDEDG
jgi:hypothetical protein